MPILINASAPDRSGWCSLRFPFNRALVDLLKQVPGSWWDKSSSVWRVSHHGLAVLEPLIKNSGLGVISAHPPRQLECPPLYTNPGHSMRPYQLDAYARMSSRTGYALTFDPRVGKGQRASDVVMTPTGPCRFDALRVGDLVFGRDGKAYPIEGVFRRGKMPVWRVSFRDGTSLDVSGDHLWDVQFHTWRRAARDPSKWVTKTTEELALDAIVEKDGHSRWYIPIAQSVEMQSLEPRPIDPYVLGVLLGDGHFGKSITITPGDLEVPAALCARGIELKPRLLGKCRAATQQTYLLPGMYEHVRALGLEQLRSWNKFIPKCYLYAPSAVRLDVLRGLLDTDGSFEENTTIFCSTSKQLADDVVFLVQSLGGVARLRSRIPTFTYKGKKKQGRRAYYVTISLDENLSGCGKEQAPSRTKFFPSRGITRIRPLNEEDEIICIKTSAPDQLYVTSNFIVTHNTFPTVAVIAQALAERRAERVIVFYPASIKEEWQVQLAKFANLTLTLTGGQDMPDEDQVVAWASQPWLVLGVHYEILGFKAPAEASEKDGPQGLLALAEQGKYIVVADEIQNIRNRNAPRTKVLLQMSAHPNCVGRYALTGTPMRNRPRDLWVLFEFLQPGSVGGYWKFCQRYCNPPEAPIWMGDYSFKPLGEIRVGDEIIGWRRGRGRRAKGNTHPRDSLCRTKVTAVHKHIAPIVKVTFASGRWLRCTSDHLWNVDNHLRSGLGSPRYERIRADREAGKSLKELARDYKLAISTISNICTGASGEFLPAKVGRKLMHVVETRIQYPAQDKWWLAGWLAGMYDGEGSRAFISQSSVANPETWQRLGEAAAALGIPYSLHADRGPTNAGGLQITNGRAGFFKFISTCNPRRRSGWDALLLGGRFRTPDEIVSIEPDGEGEVIGLTTETGNYVAWGYASKNCGAHQGQYGWVDKGSTNEEELNTRLNAVSYRLRRADVAAYLPKSDRRVFMCSLNEPVRKEYDAAARELSATGVLTNALSESEPSAGTIRALEHLSAITTKAKLTTLVERVAFHAIDRGVKVLVFANFHDSLKQVWDVLDPSAEAPEEEINTSTLSHDIPAEKPSKKPKKPLGAVPVFCAAGWMTSDKRYKTREQWKACPGPAVLLANTMSSGVGIDLSDADAAIFIELCWVPADFNQAESRIIDIHLGKRTTPPLFEYLLTRGTIDSDMGLALIEKVQNIEAVVGHDESLSQMANTLRGSGVVDVASIALNKADPAAVATALSRLRDRLLGRVSDPSAKGQAALAVGLEEVFTEDEEKKEGDDDDDDPEAPAET